MNYDFQLNKNGDILFKQSNRDNSSLQLDFYVAESKGLMFNFYIDSYIDEQEYLNDLDPEFIFEFYIDTPKNNKEILCIENKEDYLYQQLKIRLNSALGTIKGNEEIGSTIDNYRHILLNPDFLASEFLSVTSGSCTSINFLFPYNIILLSFLV